ncbi:MULTISPECIES: hypothetical protein [Okeania]|uniref:hypothetical protein n=1 Tax=Okeania TaxID=1458928 RepID=UPI00195F5482|nr:MULTISPECIES: hypothetical protein [Okeania]
MNHQFLQRRFMGKVKPTLLETSKGENWVEAKYKFSEEPHAIVNTNLINVCYK